MVSSASDDRVKDTASTAGESKWAIPLDMIDGYQDGFRGELAPGENRSNSYRHGWKVGNADRCGVGAFMTADLARAAAQEAIERDYAPAEEESK